MKTRGGATARKTVSLTPATYDWWRRRLHRYGGNFSALVEEALVEKMGREKSVEDVQRRIQQRIQSGESLRSIEEDFPEAGQMIANLFGKLPE